jgi:hypothetical protein
MLLQNGIVFFKCFTCFVTLYKSNCKYTEQKTSKASISFWLLPCPALSQKGLGVSAEARPRPPRVLRAIAANTQRAAFASLRCSSVTRPQARAHASVVDLSSPCSLSRLQVSKRSETEAASTVPSKLFSGKIPPPLRWVFVHFFSFFMLVAAFEFIISPEQNI